MAHGPGIMVAATLIRALKWMLFAVGGLVLLLMAVQLIRGDADAQPAALATGGIGAIVLGLVCGHLARRFDGH